MAIGIVRRAHGLGGEVRVEAYNEESTLLLQVTEVDLRLRDGTERTMRVESSRSVRGAFLVRFGDVHDRDAADALRGAEVLVARGRLPQPGPGEFYHCDLVGLTVHGPDGALLGEVVGVERSPAHDLLVVSDSSEERLIPLADVFVRRIDLESGRIDLESADTEGDD